MAVGGLKCILHAEDDENDRFLFQKACEETGLKHLVQWLEDGKAVTAYLSAAAAGTDPLRYPLPSLLVMDLKMPRMDGLEVLAWIRQHEVLKPLPVVMLSNSSMPADIVTGYRLGANAYLMKPGDYLRLLDVARFIQTWLDLCEPAFGLENG